MIFTLESCVVHGLEVQAVDIEVDVSRGHPSFNIVGLPDTAIREAIERVRLAIRNSGFNFPFEKRIVINLAPATIRKHGAFFDVAMALGIIMASGVSEYNVNESLFFGELSLNGDVKAVKGILPQIIYGKKHGIKKFYLPKDNCLEASLIDGIQLIPIQNLKELVDILEKKTIVNIFQQDQNRIVFEIASKYDMKFIQGHKKVKRVLEIAAAGGHNCLLIGSPGCGKTLLAKTFPTILPKMSQKEMIEVANIYSISGKLQKNIINYGVRPFRAPHHSATLVAVVGGGRIPFPGEISLAHRGVLFLDEFLEFPSVIIDALRQPLEDGEITINRTFGSYKYPAKFKLLAACNPCPCGYYMDLERECLCTQQQIRRYQYKLSGPIIDRIDLFVEVSRENILKKNKKTKSMIEESSSKIRERVEKALALQRERFLNTNLLQNNDIQFNSIKNFCKMSNEAEIFLEEAIRKYYLSHRAYIKILKIARTIADLDGDDTIDIHHVAETLQYRQHTEYLCN